MSQDPFLELVERLPQLDREAARRALVQAAEADPRDPRPLVVLAGDCMETNEVDAAEALFLGALQRAPGLAIARFQLGLLQLTSGRPAVARTTWAPLEALGAKDPLRLFKVGLEALAEDRFEDARAALVEGVSVNASNPPLSRDMLMVVERIDQRLGNPPASAAPTTGTEEHVLVSEYRKVH